MAKPQPMDFDCSCAGQDEPIHEAVAYISGSLETHAHMLVWCSHGTIYSMEVKENAIIRQSILSAAIDGTVK